MFDLQGTSLYARYCIQGSGNVSWSGSIKTTSIIRDAAGKVFSEKVSQWGTDGFASGMPGDCSTSYAYDEIKSGFIPGSTYTLTVNSIVAGITHSLTKIFTIAGGSSQATNSEYQPNPAGLGGYAVIHPDSHVCGVIVGNSYFAGNDKTMTTSYMGCPVGSRIIFQTKPSPSGNVSGWHGADVFFINGIFVLGNGTTISNGIATDPNGRVWDTGSGATIKSGSVTPPTQTDTKTATTQTDTKTATTQTDTKTATTQTDTKTATTQTDTKTASIALPIASDTSIATVLQLTSLSVNEKEELLKVALRSTKSATIDIAVDIPKLNLVVTATKKGFAPITFKVKTNADGDAQIKTNKNLTGFTVTLLIGKVKLDSDLARK
jgi:cell division septation protein DedD